MLFMQLHNRLLPIRCSTVTESISSNLSLTSLCTDLGNFHVEQFLDRFLDIVFSGLTMNLKRILVVSRSTMHTLFGDQRAQQNLMRFKLNAGVGFRRWLYPCHLSHFVFLCLTQAVASLPPPLLNVPSLILSSAARVISMRLGLRTLSAFSSLTGCTETPARLRPLL